MTNEQSSHVAIKISDSATGEETNVIIDTEGNQVQVGDDVDDDTQTFLDSIGDIMSSEEPGDG